VKEKEKIKLLHWIFVGQGNYEEAWRVLKLLREGSVRLGFDDVSINVREWLDKLNVCYADDGDCYYPYCYYMGV